MCRKLKEQERKGKGGEERGVMIDDTETRRDIETDTEGYNLFTAYISLSAMKAWQAFLLIIA